jgi:NhaP-type Na+/H+ or K+/H+ antiporter
MLGGTRGALSLALAASVTFAFANGAGRTTNMTTVVLGVAFISISIQAAFLFQYIKRRFPEENKVEVEELNVKVSNAIAAIETLQRLKEEGSIS